MKYDRRAEFKNRQRRRKNLRIAKFEVENMLKKGESINVTVLSRAKAGFSRSYFYRNKRSSSISQTSSKRRNIF